MLTDQITGALLGLACGDALGAPIEFMDPITVRRRYGKVTDMMASGTWAAGEWTDDTSLALCLAEGILASPEDPVPTVGQHILAWSEKAKDFSATLRAVLSRFQEVGDWTQAARSTPQAQAGLAGGNGSLVRTLPVALAYAEEQLLLHHSARLSALTHWDGHAELCCTLYCLWVRGLLAGEGMSAAWNGAFGRIRELAETGKASEDTPGIAGVPASTWERLGSIPSRRYEDLQPSGFASHCVDCLEAAVWCCLQATDAEQAILDAVNLAGEADTLGAVTGGAAGAHWGESGLPSRWLRHLCEADRLTGIGKLLAALRDRL